MIQCPYCQSSLGEAESSCHQCGMDAEKLVKIMGPMPIIPAGVSQDEAHLNRRSMKELRKRIAEFEKRFPQSHLHFIVRSFPQKMELPVILFWVFNHGGLSLESARGGRNYDIVILIEPTRKQAGMMVGYGLEPLVAQEALDSIVQEVGHLLEARLYLEAFEKMEESLSVVLRAASQNVAKTLGLPEEIEEEISEGY